MDDYDTMNCESSWGFGGYLSLEDVLALEDVNHLEADHAS